MTKHIFLKKRRLVLASLLLAAVTNAELMSTNDLQHLDTALAGMNMARADMGFTKDVADPVWCFPWATNVLNEPLLLPVMGDDLLEAVVATNGPWRYIGEVMGVALPAPLAVSPERVTFRRYEGIEDVRLARSLSFFLEAVDAAAGLCRSAFSELSLPEQSYLAASLLGGALDVEDRPEVWEPLMASGVASQSLAQVVLEGRDLDPKPSATNYLALLDRVSFKSLLRAGWIFQQAVTTLEEECQQVETWPTQVCSFASSAGRVYVGTLGDDVFTNAALLIVDPAGDDRYSGRAGAANGLLFHSLAAILDLAGDDGYDGPGLPGPGSALFGVSVVRDVAGDDVSRAAFTGQGCGLYGVAAWQDDAGDDQYRARLFAQGAGVGGVGMLIDRQGRDEYSAGLCAQGYAGVHGVGLLIDHQGADRYLAGNLEPDHERHPDRFLSLSQGFAIGMRPFAGGGLAALVDLEGNDTYVADIYGQGVSYWYSVGMLLDRAGNDSYSVYHYGQGSGIHLSAGLLADQAGDDFYNGYILTQGNAHDFGVGMLLDQLGNDTYRADHHSQGRALNTAMALLLDRAGDDAYFARQPDQCQGVGNNGDKREYGSLALLLDLGGSDRYSCGASDGARMQRPYYGLVYDVEPAVELDEEDAP
jgi:hypothetical protein